MRSHREFIWIWIKQLKMIILVISAINIMWTDFYWGIHFRSWKTIVGTFAANSAILLFILADITEMTTFVRVVLPIILLAEAIIQMYLDQFVLENLVLVEWKGHHLSTSSIRSVAWSQIVIFSFLGLKSVMTDASRKKFYLIERNEIRGREYSTKGWTLVSTDIALLITGTVYGLAFCFKAHGIFQVTSGCLLILVGFVFFKGVKMKLSFFLEYRPALLVLAAAIILVCDIYRLCFVDYDSILRYMVHALASTVYVYCLTMAILSDFHTQTTQIFRLLVLVLFQMQTIFNIYNCIFNSTDFKVITINGHTLGGNMIERGAYCQILFLLSAQLASLIMDPSHSKFCLILKRCERKKLYLRFTRSNDDELCTTFWSRDIN